MSLFAVFYWKCFVLGSEIQGVKYPVLLPETVWHQRLGHGVAPPRHLLLARPAPGSRHHAGDPGGEERDLGGKKLNEVGGGRYGHMGSWTTEPKHSFDCFLYLEVKNTGDLEHDYAMAAYNLTCNHLHPTNLKKHSFVVCEADLYILMLLVS